MIGIYGFINSGSDVEQGESEALLEKMGQVLSHHFSLITKSIFNNNIGLGVVNRNNSKNNGFLYSEKESDISIAFSGIIYNNTELMKELENSNLDPSDQMGILIELYREKGIDFARNINGPFSCAIWDGKNKRFIIAVDRHSHRHVFYSITKDRLLFASRIKGILQDSAVERKLDEKTFGHIVNIGYPFGDGTLIEGIKWLPYGCLLIFENGATRIYRYYDYVYQEEARGVRRDKAVVLSDTITKVIERIINKNGYNTGAFLSGGMDSRTIAGVASKMIKGIDVYNHLTGHPGDIEISKWIADRLGARYHYLKLEEDYIAKHALEQVWVSEGMVDTTCSHFYSIGPQIKEVDTILDGLEGRVIFGYYLNPRKFENTSINRYFDIFYSHRWLKYFNGEIGEEIFGSKLKEYKESSREEIRDYFLNIPQEHYLNRWHYFYKTTYLPKYLKFSLSGMNLFTNIVTPYYDNEIIDFMLNTTPEERAYKRLYRMAMKHLIPDIANIPSNWYGLKPSSGEVELFTKRILAKLDVVLNRKRAKSLSRTLYSNGRIFDYAMSISKNCRDFITKTLMSKRCHDRGIFNPEGVKKLLWEHNHGIREHTKRIGYLTALELFFRLFIDGEDFNGLSI